MRKLEKSQKMQLVLRPVRANWPAVKVPAQAYKTVRKGFNTTTEAPQANTLHFALWTNCTCDTYKVVLAKTFEHPPSS